jgi:ribonuclease HI
MRESGSRIRITFQKIAAHTGDKYNEEADKLAKAALVGGKGIPEITRVQSERE